MAEIDLMGVPWDEHLASIDSIKGMKTGKVREEMMSLIALMEADRGLPVSLEQVSRRRVVLRRVIFRVSMLELWTEDSSSRARMSELA